MSDTLGSIRAEILLWLRGDLARDDDKPLVNSAINDALESVWMAMMQVQLARFLGVDSPVSFTLPAGAERVQLVSIPDPTVAPTINLIAGGTLQGRTIYVAYTLVTESGSETNLSPFVQLNVGANQLVQVQCPLPIPGQTVFGWNVYSANEQAFASLVLQNQQPLPFGNNTANVALSIPFVEPAGGMATYGDVSGANQRPPTSNSTADNISWIKHLEVRTSDTLLRSWNEYDLDSEIMRRYARTLSTASEFQTYVWDLVNGNRLEVRPAAGMTFTPRYFYVAKPRRLRYDQADIPYQHIPGVHKFLRCQAIADLKLGVDEYLAQQAYKQEAANEKAEIVKALRMEDWNKNTRVQPHLF